uniref:Glycine-rich protein n=1 Tax=Fagus sylvatica TaxID=28930 RepID=A0A2N9HTH7_FAGSY
MAFSNSKAFKMFAMAIVLAVMSSEMGEEHLVNQNQMIMVMEVNPIGGGGYREPRNEYEPIGGGGYREPHNEYEPIGSGGYPQPIGYVYSPP